MDLIQNVNVPEASKGRAYWEEQAELAWQYANARPASDMKGFFAALRDREEFLRLAAEAALTARAS